MDSCPSCNRTFERVLDYPRIYIAKIERLPIPPEINFLAEDWVIFAGPKSKYFGRKPPKPVLEFFRDNPKAQEYEYEGWVWTFDTEFSESWRTRISLSEKVKQFFGVPIKAPEAWEVGHYRRSEKCSFSTPTIMKHVSPYLDHLETLVGKEVPSTEILPKFNRPAYYYCRIPETHYDLSLEELSNDYMVETLTQKKLQVPKLETERPSRKIAFCITESSGGSISIVHYLAVLGGMAYEGRLSK
jgi:hypothetical protein